jgi:hypothetical protein
MIGNTVHSNTRWKEKLPEAFVRRNFGTQSLITMNALTGDHLCDPSRDRSPLHTCLQISQTRAFFEGEGRSVATDGKNVRSVYDRETPVISRRPLLTGVSDT